MATTDLRSHVIGGQTPFGTKPSTRSTEIPSASLNGVFRDMGKNKKYNGVRPYNLNGSRWLCVVYVSARMNHTNRRSQVSSVLNEASETRMVLENVSWQTFVALADEARERSTHDLQQGSPGNDEPKRNMRTFAASSGV